MNIKEKLKIVLITYNRKNYLKDTLNTFLSDNSPVKDFDITIIDNHSTDGTTEMLQDYANMYNNITHIINPINIGGNANSCKAFCEYLNKEYIWVICDNDSYDWSSWNEIEYAVENKYDVIMTRHCQNNISELFYKANLISSAIYKTENITSSVVENMYDNIRYSFPHLAVMAKNLNDNNKIFIVNNDIVKVGINPGYTTTLIRGRENKDIPDFKKNMFWSVGYFNSLALINSKEKQHKIIDGLRHYHKNLFELFKSIMIYNKMFADNDYNNLQSIFKFLNFKQRLKFILAYILVLTSGKNYKYWFIRYEEEWIEYLKEVNTQKYIDQLAKKFKNKRVILYGAGMFAKILFNNYDLSKLNIVGISDKKYESSEEESFNGYKTIKPSELNNTNFDILIFTMKLYKTIEKSLNKQGISQYKLSLVPSSNKFPIRF